MDHFACPCGMWHRIGNTCPTGGASAVNASLTVAAAGGITASATSRTIGGPLVRYGVPGRTSRGPLRVRKGALRFPDDLSAVKLTLEHNRDQSRGHLTQLVDDGTGLRITARVADGPDGDAALREAQDKSRDGFSYDVVDATIVGDEITDARVIAIGQVGIPAYDDMRVDSIAASAATPQTPAPSGPTGRHTMTDDQRARLTELRAKDTLTAEEAAELEQLKAMEAGEAAQASAPAAAAAAPTAQVAASIPSVPAGVPGPRPAATTSSRSATPQLDAFLSTITSALQNGASVTAALADITNTAHGNTVEAPGWSGELWSGVQYEPEFTPLLNSGSLDNYEGHGWRWKTKPALADYAGDKAAIPTNTPETEASSYSAARMAVGHDIDRKFYDFPNEAFLRSYVESVREDWAVKLDAKVEAWINANAVAYAGAASASPLLTAGRLVRRLKRTRVGRASFVVLADDVFDSLMDITADDLPAFLELFGIDPKNFTSSSTLAAGTVMAGVKQTATVRTLPGSPIRVSAQHIANGGVDEGFFGYWAIEEHHTAGVLKATVTP